MTEHPSAFDRIANPTAAARYATAQLDGTPLAYCGGCTNPADHESHCRGQLPRHAFYADTAWAHYEETA